MNCQKINVSNYCIIGSWWFFRAKVDQLHMSNNASHIFSVCMIDREALVTKASPVKLSQTMNEVIKVVNYIKSNSLQAKFFASLCEAMDSDHESLLYHTLK
jgi:hypothetical protein